MLPGFRAIDNFKDPIIARGGTARFFLCMNFIDVRLPNAKTGLHHLSPRAMTRAFLRASHKTKVGGGLSLVAAPRLFCVLLSKLPLKTRICEICRLQSFRGSNGQTTRAALLRHSHNSASKLSIPISSDRKSSRGLFRLCDSYSESCRFSDT